MAELAPVQFGFTRHPSNAHFELTSEAYLAAHQDSDFKHIATGAIVFDSPESSKPRVLLVQRAAHDTWPNRWEIPGGACDKEDDSILHAVARELLEESGLVASYVGPTIGAVQLFTSSSGKRIGKFMFFVEVKTDDGAKTPAVKLDPNEHQAFVWATEEEVNAKRKDDLELKFTTGDAYTAILQAFASHRAGQLTRT